DAIAWFLHTFRMPLFFTVAGFFAALLLARRGMAGLFRNRGARVLLPLLIFLPLLTLSMHWLTDNAVESVNQLSPLLSWLRDYRAQHGELPSLPGWLHLWFLFYLLLFTVLVWVISALELGAVGAWLAKLPVLALPLALPLLQAPVLAWVSVPWPAPEFLLPSLWALLYFGSYFALGFLLYRHTALLDRWRRFAPWVLLAAVIAYALLFWLSNGLRNFDTTPLQHFSFALLQACTGFWLTLWCLLAAQRWLHSRSAGMRWLADASYWVYLVHLPVLFALQYRLLDWPLHWALKFVMATAATFALCLLSYQLLVRHSVIGRLLNGSTPAHRRAENAVSAV
ncbi:MAG TPA: acyltransferase family protein, partial [Permianibacter sp.]|nr:acyltransferase family protein [Permianibacter sp.]